MPSRLLTNTSWNLAGQLLPLLVGIAVLPLLIRTMGLDRYGFLTLVWVLVGYAGVFDFGIGRALIRVVAQRLSLGDAAGARHVAHVGLTYLGIFGLAAAALCALLGDWAVAEWFKLPPELVPEARFAMWLLAASLPFVMLTAGFVSVLSAHQQFRGMNIARALMGVATYLGPLFVALWINRLDAVVGFVLLMRIAAAAVHAALTRRGCGFAFRPALPDRETTRELFAIGGWVSLSNIISPLLTYLDRLLLSALVPIRMVAYYAAPFDLTSKAMILPYALIAAQFPDAAGVAPNSEAAQRMLRQSIRLLFVMIFPLVFAIVALAWPGLSLWLGADFAANAALPLQLLALGVLLNALAQAPAMLIQAAGRPRVMALLHLAELPLFAALLYAMTQAWGIVGTAAAAALRNGLDAIAVMWLARREMASGEFEMANAVAPGLMAVALLALALLPRSLGESLALLVLGCSVFAVYSWRQLLMPHERLRLREWAGLAA